MSVNGNGTSVKTLGSIALAVIGLATLVIKSNADFRDVALQELREHYVTKENMENRWLQQEQRWSHQDRKLDRIESKLEALAQSLKRGGL